MICWRCDGCLWVCETHPERPWLGSDGCECGAAGVPCPICNPSDEVNPPRLPEAFSRWTSTTAACGIDRLAARDAGNYIARLPKREHDAPEWHAAIKALMLVVEHGGDTMLPRIGIMRVLYRHHKSEPRAAQEAGEEA